ncbi:uncharacterized protein LOC108106625 [Drosophila eugracilis]|uniref:uncharacterized protein LOC108106625 n=1 Tax=Drosophila eugracilis TaxID=29029 RepID=UPI0007E68937|nr:uncharacterized protein LOC108106625 [Drosophila eugracilis]
MSSTFEQHLNEIVSELWEPPNHRDVYIVRDFVMNILKSNKVLTSTCSLKMVDFGSRPLGIHTSESNFNVMVLLKFPYIEDILVRPDQHRPGMVHLDFSRVPFNDFTDVLLDKRYYLKRNAVHNMMEVLLENVHGCQFWGNRDYYKLQYSRCGDVHIITAKSRNHVLSIDFMPAIDIYYDGFYWEAVPKWAPGPKRSDKCTFMISAIEEEIFRFKQGGENIINAVVLLKAMCESKNLPKVCNYHLVSTAIGLISTEYYRNLSLQYVFLYLLEDLADAFDKDDLSYFCYEDLDLIPDFNTIELNEYANALNDAYMTLKTYPDQDRLSYGRCSSHFLAIFHD